jgi:hypothetical protein
LYILLKSLAGILSPGFPGLAVSYANRHGAVVDGGSLHRALSPAYTYYIDSFGKNLSLF